MKIVLISGLSGSGKSVALKQLEDSGFYCVDNLPLEMLPSLVLYHIERGEETQLGVSVDIRSGINIQEAQEQIQFLRDEGHQVEVLFVEAEEGVLVRRFSETAAAILIRSKPDFVGKPAKKNASGSSRLETSHIASIRPK